MPETEGGGRESSEVSTTSQLEWHETLASSFFGHLVRVALIGFFVKICLTAKDDQVSTFFLLYIAGGEVFTDIERSLQTVGIGVKLSHGMRR